LTSDELIQDAAKRAALRDSFRSKPLLGIFRQTEILADFLGMLGEHPEFILALYALRKEGIDV
jgi:hypothetical protein